MIAPTMLRLKTNLIGGTLMAWRAAGFSCRKLLHDLKTRNFPGVLKPPGSALIDILNPPLGEESVFRPRKILSL